jgi:hypothetical protein
MAPRETPAPEEPTLEVRKASVQEMLAADGTSLVASSVEVDGASPEPSDDTGRSLQDLVVRGTGISVPGSAAPCDAAPAPGSLGALGSGVSGWLLLCYLGFPPPPIESRQVGDNAESAGSWVAVAERLLHETLALVN